MVLLDRRRVVLGAAQRHVVVLRAPDVADRRTESLDIPLHD